MFSKSHDKLVRFWFRVLEKYLKKLKKLVFIAHCSSIFCFREEEEKRQPKTIKALQVTDTKKKLTELLRRSDSTVVAKDGPLNCWNPGLFLEPL